MATPKGLSYTSQMAKMGADPLRQMQLREAQAQRGRDNMAVGMENRILGQQIAESTERDMDLDRAGRELSRRKDDLAFSRDVRDFEREQFAEESRRHALGLDLGRSALADYEAKTAAMSDADDSGLEMALGIASVGAEMYRGYKSKKMREKEKKEQEDYGKLLLWYKRDRQNEISKGITVTGWDWTDEEL